MSISAKEAWVEFNHCLMDAQEDGIDILIAPGNGFGAEQTIICRSCSLKTATAVAAVFDTNAANVINLILIDCKDADTAAAGKLFNLNNATLNLFLIGTKITSLTVNVEVSGTLNFHRDAMSEMAESLLTGAGTKNIVRVAGDQLRLSNGTLLTVGAVADGEFPNRVGSTLVGDSNFTWNGRIFIAGKIEIGDWPNTPVNA